MIKISDKCTLEEFQKTVIRLIEFSLAGLASDIKLDDTVSSLALDSLDIIEIIMSIEEEFNIPEIEDQWVEHNFHNGESTTVREVTEKLYQQECYS